MSPGQPDHPLPDPSAADASLPSSPTPLPAGRHSLRDQDTLWNGFLQLASSVVDAMEKAVRAIEERDFALVDDLALDEEETDRREVMLEQECLRIMALYEPVASDLRRMATVLKVNRDWERIADLALRVARRARKFARLTGGQPFPAPLVQLAHDVLSQVRGCRDALASIDADGARAIIVGDKAVDAQYRSIRKQLKLKIGERPDQLDPILILMNTARNLERVADHAAGIAMTIVYLKEGTIIRHQREGRVSDS
ncbi:phosphate signaling complex protein PhoU [Aquisphaera insulae]|uniref:phosphate signaling complex protein PhoU n=1 Tax=Aquisphaera insulae TaxID=2712864 RepID=UPI0013EB6368|nr:phosphate signaling complex protein PhoU [Aquisphaera insulae]